MKSLTGLYFNLEIKDNNEALSMVRQSLRQIERLQGAGVHVKYLQLRANELSDSQKNKEIWLKIDSDQGTYIASDVSLGWEQAFHKTLKAVEKKILYEETDYTRPIVPEDLASPLAGYSLATAGQY
jgi:hypothetical protein